MKHATTTNGRHGTDRSSASLTVATLACCWIGLVAIGACGRLWQPGWNITPMAGVALAAGAVFPNPLMAAVVYAATAWPVVLGRRLSLTGGPKAARWLTAAGSALASSLVFFATTNLAHWWLTNDYPHTAAGLVACYSAALPFYRWMPAGDVGWTVVIFAGLSAVLAAMRASRAAAAA